MTLTSMIIGFMKLASQTRVSMNLRLREYPSFIPHFDTWIWKNTVLMPHTFVDPILVQAELYERHNMFITKSSAPYSNYPIQLEVK